MRHAAVILFSTLISMAAVFTAAAEEKESKIKITSVTLEVDSSDLEDSEEVNVTSDYGHYTVDSVTVTNVTSNGKSAKVRVVLEAEDGYIFNNLSESRVNLRGDKAKFVSANVVSNKTKANIVLQAGTGSSWDKDDDNKQKKDSRVNSSVTDAHIRYYEGTGIAMMQSGTDAKTGIQGASEGKKSELPQGNTLSGPGAGWKHDGKEYYYITAEGKPAVNGWLEVDGKWYCFDPAGHIRTGWIEIGDNWYYCDESDGPDRGSMWTDRRTPDNCYVDAKGHYVPGM